MRQYSECPPTLLDLRAESLSTPGENATLNYAPPGMGESMLYEVSQARAIKSFHAALFVLYGDGEPLMRYAGRGGMKMGFTVHGYTYTRSACATTTST